MYDVDDVGRWLRTSREVITYALPEIASLSSV
jgi:hypothetical protein